MSSILNKLGLGGSDSTSSHSSSSSSSSSSGSSSSTRSGSMGSSSTNTTGSTNTMNKAGYADSSDYASTGYGTASTTTTTTTQTAGSTATANTTGQDYMTRSEERLLVGKEQVGAGVASLNKYVTTEHVQTSVPITKEHVVIEREPIQPGDRVQGNITEAHYEVALTEERAVAAKETVPIEKVKLRKEVEHGSQNVDADLRKEHIDYTTTGTNTGGKTLGTAPGTAGYNNTTSNTYTTGTNPANPRV